MTLVVCGEGVVATVRIDAFCSLYPYHILMLMIDTIYRLPLMHQATAISNLRLRYESLTAMSSDLPSNISAPAVLDAVNNDSITPFLYPPISSTSFQSPNVASSPPSFDSSALALSLFGWQAEPSLISGLVICPACFRRLGLWLFKPPDHASSPRSSPISPSMTRLDVIAEHRDYCPWINPASQSGTSSTTQAQARTSLSDLAGWEILLRALKNVQSTQQRESIQPVVDSPKIPPPTSDTAADNTAADTASEATNVNDEPSDARSGIAASVLSEAETRATRDEKDKERWAKLKKLKQVFHVKRRKDKFIVRDREKPNELPKAKTGEAESRRNPG